MTLLECLRQEALRLGRCGLSSKELSRVEVMGRVKAGSLRLQEAAELLWLSYRQAKRVWAHSRRTGSIQTLPPALPGIPTASKMSRRDNNERKSEHSKTRCGGQQAAASGATTTGGLPSLNPFAFSRSHHSTFPLPIAFASFGVRDGQQHSCRFRFRKLSRCKAPECRGSCADSACP